MIMTADYWLPVNEFIQDEGKVNTDDSFSTYKKTFIFLKVEQKKNKCIQKTVAGIEKKST